MRAPAKNIAAVRATISRTRRLREGSIWLSIITAAAGRSARRAVKRRLVPPARMTLAGPWRQDQEQPGIGARPHLVALLGLEVGKEAGPAALAAAALLDLHLAVDHHEVGALVHLVVLEQLAARKVDRDHARLVVGAEDPRVMRSDIERADVPAVQLSPPPSTWR